MKHILYLYGIIVILLIASLGSVYIPNMSATWINNYVPNIVSTLGGTILTVTVIDRLIRRREEEENKKVAKPAYRQLYNVLHSITELCEWMMSVSHTKCPARVPKTGSQMFALGMTDILEDFDFSAPGRMSESESWANTCFIIISNAQLELQRTLDTYIQLLPPEYVSAVNAVMDHGFISHLRNTKRAISDKEWANLILHRSSPHFIRGTKELRDDFFRLLVKTLQTHAKNNTTNSIHIGHPVNWEDDIIGGPREAYQKHIGVKPNLPLEGTH
jgi:hypothetical protein